MSHGSPRGCDCCNNGRANKYRGRSTICRRGRKIRGWRIGARERIFRVFSPFPPTDPSNTDLPHVRRFGYLRSLWHARLCGPRWPRGRCWPWLLADAECRTLTLTSRDSWPIDAQMVERKGWQWAREWGCSNHYSLGPISDKFGN